MNETFGERVSYCMKSMKINQSELASMIGVHRSTVSRYLKDEFMPDISTVMKIADALKINYEYLIGAFVTISDSDFDYGLTETMISNNIDKWSPEQKDRLKKMFEENDHF